MDTELFPAYKWEDLKGEIFDLKLSNLSKAVLFDAPKCLKPQKL